MAQCITCGTELHPDRARKYNYCTAKECQEKNFKGLTMVAVGLNKAAEEFLVLDDQTREDLAAGKVPWSPACPPRQQPRRRAGPAAGTGRKAGPGPQAVEPVTGETRAAVQRAGNATGRDSAEAGRAQSSGHADHPGR
jgi:hypothetical protein